MKTINELKEIARQYFLEYGFTDENLFKNCDATYIMADKCDIITETHITYKGEEYKSRYAEGLVMSVSELHRHNGTEANQSIAIEITKWNANTHCGRRIYKNKIYNRNGDKKIYAILAEAVEVYDTYSI